MRQRVEMLGTTERLIHVQENIRDIYKMMRDEHVVMDTIAMALAGGENDYPELPFPTGFSGDAKKSKDAYEYGMTRTGGKN